MLSRYRVAVTLFASLALPALGQSSQTIVLTHAVLIDGTGAQPRRNQSIVVRGDRIVDVFPDGARKFPGARVVDLTGRYVIPGLIDAHVHVATDPKGRDSNAADQLRGALLGGVTSVRDMAGDAIVLRELAIASDAPENEFPRISFAAVMGGPTFFEDPRTRAAAHGQTPGQVPWLRAIGADDDIPAAVAAAKETGATGIKVYADLPPDIVKRIVLVAHARGLKVWSHATIFPSRPGDAVDAGVDVISHAILLYWEGATDVPARYHARVSRPVYDSVDAHGPAMDSLFRRMRRRGTVLDATLFISSRLEAAPGGTAGMADPRRAVQWMYDVTRYAKESGVAVAAGTDGMMPGSTSELPNIHRELELLVTRSGFTPLEAITSATLNGARAIGIDSLRGTVTTGKLADIVVLNADPTIDIRNTRQIQFVMKGGHIHARNAALANLAAPAAR
jgi:imidazolonepropionase-like amidohydrolase